MHPAQTEQAFKEVNRWVKSLSSGDEDDHEGFEDTDENGLENLAEDDE